VDRRPYQENLTLSTVHGPSSFLLEIGVEELPANDVDTAYEALSTRVPTLLKELYLDHGDVRVFATPRRLVVSIDSLSPNQPDREDLVKGPPADKAIVGRLAVRPPLMVGLPIRPTQAAMGFAKKNGIMLKTCKSAKRESGRQIRLRRRQTKGTPDSRSPGRSLAQTGREHQVREVHALE
jgi:glycyl-tRNA synthetase beta subunit